MSKKGNPNLYPDRQKKLSMERFFLDGCTPKGKATEIACQVIRELVNSDVHGVIPEALNPQTPNDTRKRIDRQLATMHNRIARHHNESTSKGNNDIEEIDIGQF